MQNAEGRLHLVILSSCHSLLITHNSSLITRHSSPGHTSRRLYGHDSAKTNRTASLDRRQSVVLAGACDRVYLLYVPALLATDYVAETALRGHAAAADISAICRFSADIDQLSGGLHARLGV